LHKGDGRRRRKKKDEGPAGSRQSDAASEELGTITRQNTKERKEKEEKGMVKI